MAMSSRKKRKKTRSGFFERRRARRNEGIERSPRSRAFLWIVGLGLLAAATGFGFSVMERRVLSGEAGVPPERIRVVLADAPDWMPGMLGYQIAAELSEAIGDYYDPALVRRVYQRAGRDPWIHKVRRVEKRRGDDPRLAVIDVYAEYRMAVAKVYTPAGHVYVDREGVRLPASQVPRYACREGETLRYYLDGNDAPARSAVHPVHYIQIEGVQSPPPPVGRQWKGEDLAAGLRLVELVSDRSYAWQITSIDVRNYGGRIFDAEPHLRMYAQVDQSNPTDIRFGRFPMPEGDYVVSPERKMSYLDAYVSDHDGRLAGSNRYLDLRYDELHVSLN